MTSDTEIRLVGEGLWVERADLSKATPRPWTRWAEDLRGGRYFTISRGPERELIDLHVNDNGEADSALIVTAINAYDFAREQRIKELIEAAREAERKFGIPPRLRAAVAAFPEDQS